MGVLIDDCRYAGLTAVHQPLGERIHAPFLVPAQGLLFAPLRSPSTASLVYRW